MADQHIIFWLTPGQMAPVGSTGIMLSNGGIMWVGEEDTFPTTALTGTHLNTDITPSNTYSYRVATTDEVTEYDTALNTEFTVDNPV